MNQRKRSSSAINRDILKILMNEDSNFNTIRFNTQLNHKPVKSALYTLLKYRLVQLTITSKKKQMWSITAKGREYYTKMNEQLVALDNLLNPKIQNYPVREPSAEELILIDLQQGNHARRAIIEELELK